jgi:hypothetical protein
MSASTSGGMWGRPGEALFRTVEFTSDEPAVPGENSVGLRYTRLPGGAQRGQAAYQSQRGWIARDRKAHAGRQVRSENPVLRCEVFILEEQFLVREAADIGQHARPLVVLHC